MELAVEHLQYQLERLRRRRVERPQRVEARLGALRGRRRLVTRNRRHKLHLHGEEWRLELPQLLPLLLLKRPCVPRLWRRAASPSASSRLLGRVEVTSLAVLGMRQDRICGWWRRRG